MYSCYIYIYIYICVRCTIVFHPCYKYTYISECLSSECLSTLKMLDMICTYLIPEDLLSFSLSYQRVKKCSVYQKLMGETVEHEDMWIDIANYRRIHENCIYVCLSKITMNPHYMRHLEIEDDEELKYPYDGHGIFCYGWSHAEFEGGENSRYDKDIVPLKKHFDCNFEYEENKEVFCVVHENSLEYQQSICYLRREGDVGLKIIMKMMMMYLLLY